MSSRRKFLSSLGAGLALALHPQFAYPAQAPQPAPRIITGISKGNTVNTLFALSQEYLGTRQETVASAKQTLVDICNQTSQALAKEKDSRDPRAFFLATARAVEDTGIRYGEGNTAFAEGLAKKSTLDCDTLGFAYIAVGHELNVPVKGIRLPRHFAVRICDLNFDPAIAAGKNKPASFDSAFMTNNEYIELYQVTSTIGSKEPVDQMFSVIGKTHIEEGIYLSPLTAEQLKSDMLLNIQSNIKSQEKMKGLVAKSLELDPKNQEGLLKQTALLLLEGKTDESVNRLQEFTAKNSSYGDIHFMISELYLKKIQDNPKQNNVKTWAALLANLTTASELIPENGYYRQKLEELMKIR